MQRSGARIISANIPEEGFTVRGDAEQVACAKRLILQKVECSNNDSSYLLDLTRAALESLHVIKREVREGNEYLEADMWCHFGTAVIRDLMKVWVAKENTKKKLEDIPIPFNDVKNILDEIHFEDGLTRSRCRGWMVLRISNIFAGRHSVSRLRI
ncbi:hypothetical protein OS493_038890 [Desmophyllum pertusum]|uniref:Uncharacterized protein n=1 Tax=Desmophyllum pertusum TaxID=174260 RepID=A0A9W9Z694_9CNID|nr:hypothetical protein OS493_038890 [Desmophyllum pertusum]